METSKIEEIVFTCVKQQLDDDSANVSLSYDISLIGSERILDSMGLVNLLVDIESLLTEENVNVTLMSENAMSSRISPFRSIGSLIRHIDELVKQEINE